jgi:hypothetical protein
LSKIEGTTGHPEKPFSDLGLRGYESFWASALLRELILACDALAQGAEPDDASPHTATTPSNAQSPPPSPPPPPPDRLTIDMLARRTGIRVEDIMHSFQLIGLLDLIENEEPHTASESDETMSNTMPVTLRLSRERLYECARIHRVNLTRMVDPRKIRYHPWCDESMEPRRR